jgi:hypothetical protein
MNACFSPDGTKLGIYDLVNGTYLFDFDRCSGSLSKYTHISHIEPQAWLGGVCFSPNSRFLYLTERFDYLHQYDTQVDSIVDSDVIVAVNDSFQYAPFPISNPSYLVAQYFCRPMLAPDNKVYVVSGDYTQMMTTIESPDMQGVNCNAIQHNIILPTMNRESVPNYTNYKLGSLNCTVSTEKEETKQKNIKILPNPTTGALTLTHAAGTTLKSYTIADISGKIIAQNASIPSDNTLHLDLPNGVYFLIVNDVNGVSTRHKVVILK